MISMHKYMLLFFLSTIHIGIYSYDEELHAVEVTKLTETLELFDLNEVEAFLNTYWMAFYPDEFEDIVSRVCSDQINSIRDIMNFNLEDEGYEDIENFEKFSLALFDKKQIDKKQTKGAKRKKKRKKISYEDID